MFFGFTAIGYCLILWSWSYLIPYEAMKKNMNYQVGSYGHMFSRMSEIKQVKNVDILVLGSSHAYRGFDPRIFERNGIRVFNLGSSNQTPKQALSLLRTYIDELNPKLVLYEVYPGIFQNDGVESSLDLIANEELNWETLNMATRVNHLKTYNTLLFDIFMESIGANRHFREPEKKGDDLYIPGGYVEKSDGYTRKQKMGRKSSWNFREDQWGFLVEMVNFINKRQGSFLMVQSPVDREYFQLFDNQDEMDEKFQSLGDYINFNRLMELEYPKDLYDLHHLRQSGVEKFNEELIKEITERNYLK